MTSNLGVNSLMSKASMSACKYLTEGEKLFEITPVVMKEIPYPILLDNYC